MATSSETLQLLIKIREEGTAKLNAIQKTLTAIGGTYLSLQGLQKVWAGAKEAISWTTGAAMEAERVWSAVGNSIRNVGENTSIALPLLKRFAEDIQDRVGITDEAIGEATSRLIQLGMSSATAMRTVAVAVDFAAARNMDLVTATDLLGRAYQGSTTMLARYGVVLDEGLNKSEKYEAAMKRFTDIGMGAAETRAHTLAGEIERMMIAFEELGESLGEQNAKGGGFFSRQAGNIAEYLNYLRKANSALETLGAILGQEKTWADIDHRLAQEKEELEILTKTAGIFSKKLEAAIPVYTDFLKNLTEQETKLRADEAALLAYGRAVEAGIIQPLEAANKVIAESMEESIAELTTSHFTTEETDRAIDYVRSQQRDMQTGITRDLMIEQDKRNRVWDAGWQKAADSTKKTLTEAMKSWHRAIDPISLSAARGFVGVMTNAGNNAADALFRAFQGEAVKFKEIWKQMAKDFLTYFIEETVKYIAIQAAAMIFLKGGGAVGGIPGLSNIPGEGLGNMLLRPTTINFNGPVTSREFVRHDIIPAIVQGSMRRNNRIQITNRNITGGAAVEY